MTHICAVPHCGEPVVHGHLMCRAHWRRVPNDVRADLAAAERAWRAAASTLARREALAVLRIAQAAAVDAVVAGRETQP